MKKCYALKIGLCSGMMNGMCIVEHCVHHNPEDSSKHFIEVCKVFKNAFHKDNLSKYKGNDRIN